MVGLGVGVFKNASLLLFTTRIRACLLNKLEAKESLLLWWFLYKRIHPHCRTVPLLSANERVSLLPTIEDQIFTGLADGDAFKALLVAEGRDEVLESLVLEFGVAYGGCGAGGVGCHEWIENVLLMKVPFIIELRCLRLSCPINWEIKWKLIERDTTKKATGKEEEDKFTLSTETGGNGPIRGETIVSTLHSTNL